MNASWTFPPAQPDRFKIALRRELIGFVEKCVANRLITKFLDESVDLYESGYRDHAARVWTRSKLYLAARVKFDVSEPDTQKRLRLAWVDFIETLADRLGMTIDEIEVGDGLKARLHRDDLRSEDKTQAG